MPNAHRQRPAAFILDLARRLRSRRDLARSHWLLLAQMRSGRLGLAAPQVPEGRLRRGV